jgi:hypothetical protein
LTLIRGSGRRLAAIVGVLIAACNEPYRVGEYVLVEWDGRNYPAYVIERKGETRFRVHYDGYDPRWDEDVTLERIKGRIKGPVTPPPPPEKVARAAGITHPAGSGSAPPVATFKVGDRVKVLWRGSIYAATIVGVVSPDRFLVHYDGHESAWDETVEIDRIVGTR